MPEHHDVEGLLQEVIQMEGRVGQMQTERLELEQRVLVAQQRQVQHIRLPPKDAEELEKAEEARLRKQLEGVKAQVRAKEAELNDLVENDPRAALVVKIQQGVDKYVGDSRKLRRALHEQKELLTMPGTHRSTAGAAARPAAAEVEISGMRMQAQQAAQEVAAMKEQAELLAAETARWEAQAAELRATLSRRGGGSAAPRDGQVEGGEGNDGAHAASASEALSQLEGAEAVAEQRHRLALAEQHKEQAALEAQLESTTRQIGVLMADMPHYAELDVSGRGAR